VLTGRASQGAVDLRDITLSIKELQRLHDRVLVQAHRKRRENSWRVDHSRSAKEKPAEGEVVSVGEGARKDSGELIPMAVKAGDKVLFGKWSGTEVTIDGEEMLMMKESDIMIIPNGSALIHPLKKLN
jgi:chaperonin GroES